MIRAWGPVALTYCVGLIGAGVALLIQLPLPWLLGPMLACLVACLFGAKLGSWKAASNTMRTILGVAVGASITPAVAAQLGSMAAPVALVPPFIFLIGALGYPYFRRLCGFDPATSYYAAMPGGLQDMLIFGEEAGGDARILGLLHATRVLLIVTLLPLGLTLFAGLNLTTSPGAAATSVPLHELLLMGVAAIGGWKIAQRIGLFGASILGPLLLTAALSLADIIHFRPPSEAILAAQFFIGVTVGVKYLGITVTELRRVIVAGLGFVVIMAIISALFTLLVVWLGLASPLEATLAFAPGGQAEMAIIAIMTGADVAFVITHHMTRIILVILGAPLLRRILK